MSSASKKIRIEPANGVEVLEKNTETTWALFQSLLDQHERGEPDTAPAPAEALPTQVPAAAAGEVSLEEALAGIRQNNRVCPLPPIWKKLYDALPNKQPQLATAPVTAEEWKQTSAIDKRTRFREHMEWAATQGVLQQVYKALNALPEDRWHHMGE
jgi:hypothetical protein